MYLPCPSMDPLPHSKRTRSFSLSLAHTQVRDITVEDQSPGFAALRDVVDVEDMLNALSDAAWYAQPFSDAVYAPIKVSSCLCWTD